MYEEHPHLYQVEDEETVLWRYMSIEKLELMLNQAALYFASIDSFDDKWEGVYTIPTIERIGKLFGRGRIGEYLELAREIRSTIYVNCWHSNPNESFAMWRLYASDGRHVALRTTFRRLKESLAKAKEVVHAGRIQYLDPFAGEDKTWSFNYLAPFFWKRPGFDHEREVRALLWAGDGKNSETVTAGSPGRLVPVDLEKLIEAIYLGPKADTETRDRITKTMARPDLTGVRIDTSSMDTLPFHQVSPEDLGI